MTRYSLYILYILWIIASLMGFVSCTAHRLPPFSVQQWHVDAQSGNAVSSSGLELSFGCEWMITDSSLIQSPGHIAGFPKLAEHLARGISRFPEIEVDSILFYNPHRGLLFATYHQVKPLKPSSEIWLHCDTTGVYSNEYARIYGIESTHIDDSGWENGPTVSVYTNVHYRPEEKQAVLVQRIPYGSENIAVFQIWASRPRGGKWWEEYPPGTFRNADLGNPDNIQLISNSLHASRNIAVENLKLSLSRQE